MPGWQDEKSVFEAFITAGREQPDSLFLIVPPSPTRSYLPSGREIPYSEATVAISILQEGYQKAGYGLGHRIALHLGNRPEFLYHFLALNSLGAAIVPINPDYRDDEIRYLLEHSEADLVIAHAPYLALLKSVTDLPVIDAYNFKTIPSPPKKKFDASPALDSECSLLYTSGTTGRPKGCLLSNYYHLNAGAWYLRLGGSMTLRPAQERLYNPLPLFHMNNLAICLTAMILSRNCLVLPERFSLKAWWEDILSSKATAVHYLGIIPPLLLAQPPSDKEKQHRLRYAAGAGIDPKLHDMCEKRFGFPMIEIWGMTETGRIFADHQEPRQIHGRAIGHPHPNAFEAKIIDEQGMEKERGESGELIVRSSRDDPRAGFFSGYLKDEAATEQVWRDGWFHTGDIALQQKDGMLVYVDRIKNIIRRAGENIAASEIETAVQGHPKIAQVTVLAVPDAIREEEVMACVVPALGVLGDQELADDIFAWSMERLAYFKVPGWISFMTSLPVTSTQKVRKADLFPKGIDPFSLPTTWDFRGKKKRQME